MTWPGAPSNCPYPHHGAIHATTDHPGGGAGAAALRHPAQLPTPVRHVRGLGAGTDPVPDRPGGGAAHERHRHPHLPGALQGQGPGLSRLELRLPGAGVRGARRGPGRLDGHLPAGTGRVHRLWPGVHPGRPDHPPLRPELGQHGAAAGHHGADRGPHRPGTGARGRQHGRYPARCQDRQLRPAGRVRVHGHPRGGDLRLSAVPRLFRHYPGAHRHRRRLPGGRAAGLGPVRPHRPGAAL